MTAPFDERRLAAELRRAAESYDPDADQLAERVFTETRASLHEPLAAPPRRPVRPRTVAVWLAAASVVGAVSVTQLVVRPGTGSGDRPAAPAPAGAPSSAAATTPAAATTRPNPARPATTAGRPSASPSEEVPPGSPAASVVRRTLGDRTVTVTVTPVTAGTAWALGSGGGSWVAAPSAPDRQPAEGSGQGRPIGPAQVLGSAADVVPGPFGVTRPGGPGRSTGWLTVPHDVRGAPGGIRLPIRHGTGAVSATVLTGTTSGPATVTVSLPAGRLMAHLPGGRAKPYAAVVRITLDPAAGRTALSGDVVVDLVADSTGNAVGFAGAESTG